MSTRIVRPTAVAVCHLLLWCCLGHAQDGAASSQPEGAVAAAPRAERSAPPRIEESRPVLFSMEDENGQLVNVVGMSWEDFEKAYAVLQEIGAPDQQPRYALQLLSATGAPNDGYAGLAVRLGILAREDGWVCVPLGFDRALLTETPEYEGPGEGFVHFEEDGQGYIGWVRGPADAEHELRLKLLVPLETGAERTRLRLLAPRATVSELRLRVPLPDAVGKVSRGAGLLTSSQVDDEATELAVQGFGGDLELTWYRPTRQSAQQRALLEVEGTILARIDAQGVETEAELAVNSFGVPFRSLFVYLPPGATLVPDVPGGSGDYSVVPVEGNTMVPMPATSPVLPDFGGPGAAGTTTAPPTMGPYQPSPAGPGPGGMTASTPGMPSFSFGPMGPGDTGMMGPQRTLVEVQFAEETSEPVVIRLAARQEPDAGQWGVSYRLAGFDVYGAARQWGHIDVLAESDWQIQWGDSFGVRQVEPLLSDDAVAGFDYDAQPYSLTALLVEKTTRISVDPEYVLRVGADHVELDARLMYTIRGARARRLDVVMPSGWEAVRVEPENLVALDEITQTEERETDTEGTEKKASLYSIPLREPSTGKKELRIRAQWLIGEDGGPLVLPLPRPQVDGLGTAVLTVMADDNVELIPNHDAIIGLTRQPDAPARGLPDGQQVRLSYQTEAATAVFAAELRVHSQEIAVDVASQVSLDEQAGRVVQTLAYTIVYESTDYFTLRAPQGLVESGLLEFRCDGQPVLPTVLPAEENGQGASDTVRLQIDLPQAYLGACELEVSYSFRIGELVSEGSVLPRGKPVGLPLPLVMPEEGTLASNTLTVTAPSEIRARLADDARGLWREETRQAPSPAGLQLSSDQHTARAALEVELREEEEGTTLVERAWIQTWLIPSGRRDRALFSFTSTEKELALVVPAEAALERVQVLFDGEEAEGRTDPQRRLIIPLSDDVRQGRHLLELRVDFPQGREPAGHLSIELPRLQGNVHVERLYWELAVPWNEHLLATPKPWTNEYTWRRDGYSWGRQPLLNEAELAAWVGLEPPSDGPARPPAPQGVNRYLFSSMGTVEQCELQTAQRPWILLIASGVVLAVGLLLIYVRLARHPAALLIAGVALLSVGFLYPEPARLLAQATSLGLALVLVAGLLRRIMGPRPSTMLPEGPSEVLDSASTETHYPVPVAVAHPSTQAAPTPVPPPTPGPDA